MKTTSATLLKALRHPRFALLAFFAVLTLLAGALPARAQVAGTVDTTFSTAVSGYGDVVATAVQPDGKTVIGGDFTAGGGAAHTDLARLNADGSVDGSFNASTNNTVYGMAVQTDGKLVLGGSFTSVNGTAGINNIARLNADGSVDASFTASTNSVVYSVAVQADGKLVLGGAFTTVNGMAGIGYFARLKVDGTLDTAFNAGGVGASYNVNSVAVQADGKVVLGGAFTSVNGTPGILFIARLNADGTRDTAFNVGGAGANNSVTSVAVQADGKLVLGGFFTSVNGTPGINSIARLNADGTLDTAFNAGGAGANNNVPSVAVQADGKLVLGGFFTSVNGTAVGYFARLNADGTLDTAFNAGGAGANNPVYSVAVQADGKLVLGGAFTSVNGTARSNLARLSNDPAIQTLSTPDSATVRWDRRGGGPSLGGQVTFEQSTNGGTTYTSLGAGTRVGTTETWQLTGLALPSAGLLRARGRTAGGSQNGSSGLVQQVEDFGPAGSLAVSFNTAVSGGSATIYATAAQPDGKTVIGGNFTTVGGAAHTNLARLNADGSVDASFTASTTSTVTSVAVQADGKLVLGGAFTSANGTTGIESFARLNADGTLDTAFNVGGTGANNVVVSVAVQADGKLVLGGNLTSVNGTAGINRVARLNADGTLDTGFNAGGAGANSTVNSVAVQADGKLVLGGNFTSVNGTAGTNRIARLKADGTLDSGFNAGWGRGEWRCL